MRRNVGGAPRHARIGTAGSVARDGYLDGVNQILITERLGEELHGTGLHRSHGHRDVAITGDEDDRKLHVRAHESFLEVQTALLRKSDVEDEAARRVGPSILQKLRRRGEDPDVQANRLQQILDRLANHGVVVDNEDGRLLGRRRRHGQRR